MICDHLKKIERLCREYYPHSPTPLKDFAMTLRGRDRENLLSLIDGESPQGAKDTLIRCEQILCVRKSLPNNPYGKYDKQ